MCFCPMPCCRSTPRSSESTRRCCVPAKASAPRALTTFRRVLLPLSARGIATAATFVFLLSLGFFVTPALLGGAANTHLADADRDPRQRAPGLAAGRGSGSMVLIGGDRCRSSPPPAGSCRSARSRRRADALARRPEYLRGACRRAADPADRSRSCPRHSATRASSACRRRPGHWRWWNVFFADPSWRRALMTSLEVATLSAIASIAGRHVRGARHRAQRACAANVADRAVRRPGGGSRDRARRGALCDRPLGRASSARRQRW